MDARIYANGTLLYSSAANDAKSALIQPQVKSEIGKAGSLTFTILPTHPMYGDIQPFKTFMRVTLDGAEIFYGRVLDISRDMYNQKSVTCEGDLAFLIDSVCTPNDYNQTPSAFLSRAIGWHNNQVEDAKKFTVGTVSSRIGMRNTSVKFDISSYETVADTLETELIGYYGGYLRTRANQNGSRYVDWVQDGDSSSNQVIEYGSQMLDLTHDERANDLFTYVLAVGDSNSEDGTDYEFPTYKYEVPGAVAQFGKIVHVESFSGISDTNKLKTLAQEYANTHYDPYPTELSIKAIDLHILDSSVQTIIVGNTVKIQSTPHGISKNLMCVSIDYDLGSPENTSYVFGHPKQSLSQKYSKEKKESKAATSKAAKSGGKAGGGGKKNAQDLEEAKATQEEKNLTFKTDINNLVATAQHLTQTYNDLDVFARNVYMELQNFTIQTSNKFEVMAREIRLKADKIELDAYLTVTKLANLSTVFVKNLVSSGMLSASTAITVKGQQATWKDAYVLDEVSAKTKSINQVSVSGGQITGVFSTTVASGVSTHGVTLHYLGRS